MDGPGTPGILSTKTKNTLLKAESAASPMLDTTFSVTEVCLFSIHSIFSSVLLE